MPAEWLPHKATWLAWPHDKITFGSLNELNEEYNSTRLGTVEERYVEIIKAIHLGEDVNLIVLNEEMENRVKEMLFKNNVDLSKINFYITQYADVWIRDYGPTFVKNKDTGEKVLIKWKYYSYGGKFPDLFKDNEVFLNLKKYADREMIQPDIFMEGGAIEVNGEGILLTTEECLLNPNRNPNLNKIEIENLLKENLGVNKIIWLTSGLTNDHTDGHIDDIAKFVNPNTILVAYEEDQNDENFKILDQNFKILENALDQDGKPFNLIKIPMPHMNYSDGRKAPASYANFYITNKVILVPIYNDPNDNKALEIIQSCFPDRKVAGIDCREIIYGGGAIHCITQQEPI